MFNGQLKNFQEEVSIVQSRLICLGVFVLLLTLILVARIWFLQIYSFDRFNSLSEDNRISLLAVPPNRGEVRDRNNNILASNMSVYILQATRSSRSGLDNTIDRLSRIISFTPWELKKARQAAKFSAKFEPFSLKLNLTDEEVAIFAVNQHLFPNVSIQAQLQRHYPYANELAHVLGYVARLSKKDLERVDPAKYKGVNYIGKRGIESSYEDKLLGTAGFEQVEQNAHGRKIRILEQIKSSPGKDLQLFLDIDLQKAAREALGDYRGSVVAIDPKTAGVLAMVSTPTYDPNKFVNGIDHKSYSALRNDINKPLLNRSISGRYAPGSTIKGLFSLVGFQNGFTPSKKILCPGWYSLRGKKHRYRCWNHKGHGYLDFSSAIAQSCDVYFYQLAQSIGIDKLSVFMNKFGIGRKTGVDLQSEPTGLMPSREWKRRVYKTGWYPGETVISGIGQGYMLMTPIQLASVATTLANRGVKKTPKLVKNDFLGVDFAVSEQASTNTKQEYEKVINAMRQVVHGSKGTARAIGYGIDYDIAGKTGTAQVVSIAQGAKYDAEKLDEFKRDHSLFIGFAPVDNPQIALAVVVENGGSGSAVAAPIARKVFDKYFEFFNDKKILPNNVSKAVHGS